MSSTSDFFSSVARELGQRTARATVSHLGPASTPLLHHLQARLAQVPGEQGGFVGSPVFEPMFGWPEHAKTMQELATGTEPLLHSTLVAAMDAPPEDCKEQRFGKEWHPYVHQVQAWQALMTEPPNSVVVSTGTGSGKTECFLVPILNDLARRLDGRSEPLTGVHALFLYPLNALINSQRDRLRAWTAAFEGRLRFALYNGTTPETVASATQQRAPEQLLSRKGIREAPPPILVTNAVMLEFMLVRAKDRPIIEQSQGKLRWIVLDEAHTYVGSQAAEIALLLRRVLHHFGSDAANVRFIATSATIGGGEERERLAEYMASLAGVDRSRVEVVTGKRRVPELPPDLRAATAALPAVADLEKMSAEDRFVALASSPVVRRLRDALTEGPRTLANLAAQGAELDAALAEDGQNKVLALLDSATTASRSGESLLPLRGHFFVRTQGGLWACVNPACPGKRETELADDGWKFGRVFFEHHERCDACESMVLDLVFCNGCGAEYLACVQSADDNGRMTLVARAPNDWKDADGDEDEGDDVDETEASTSRNARRLVSGGTGSSGLDTDHCEGHTVDPKTGALNAPDGVAMRIVLPERDVERLRCQRCGQREPDARDLFRPFRLGAPFFLGVTIPAVLAHVPEAEKDKHPELLPLRGRRMITFTDSRQGTARFATKAQIESERNYVRSMIYHSLWERAKPPTADEVASCRKRVKVFEAAGDMEADLAAEREKLAGLEAAFENPQGRITWKEMRERLRGQRVVEKWMPQSQRLRYLPADLSPGDVASICLFRELARRPKRQNSVETLGLAALQYPFLERVGSAPREWSRAGHDLASWRAFLKVTIDFVIRAFTAVVMPADYSRWMGTNIAPKKIVEPEGPTVRNKIYAWPVVRNGIAPPRMAKLLERALGLDLSEKSARADVDAMLRAAWDQIRPFLQKDEEGYALDIAEHATIVSLGAAFTCPVTRRVLDSTTLGVSPYQTDRWADGIARCPRIEMPRPALVFPHNDTESARIAEWLRTDERVTAARRQGTWTEFSDRIAEFVDYIELGEHSAQQNPKRLRELESGFKDGNVNVLSCSTTMEMGVDIGGISAVAMNNAPPGPANFLQRAGRAGRRKETRAVSLTLCQNQPHGEAVFENPLWPFTTPIHVPSVSLSSDRIVLRHVASLALAAFLRNIVDNALRLTTAFFFVTPEATTESNADRFARWCTEDAPKNDHLADGIRRLVQRSNLALTDTSVLLSETAARLSPVTEAWTSQRQLLLESLGNARGSRTDAEPATVNELAVQNLLERHEGEYLLKMLASSGFLPAYGFPVGVLPFVNTTAEYLQKERAEHVRRKAAKASGEEDPKDRDDVIWKRTYPSRELAMAIREYAPGSGVIINGMVYESAGVTLNWQLPPGDEAERNPQELRWAWRCKRCGMHGHDPSEPSACRRCGADQLTRFRYIRPAGFAVDIRFKPHNDVTQQKFVHVEDPWISARDASWQALPRAEAGRYRYHPEGLVFHWNGGPNPPYGYAVCLRCGRAAAETGWATDCDVPPEMAGHRPLRSKRQGDEDGICVGNPPSRAVQRNLRLAGDSITDVVQLQLSDAETGAPLADLTQASSIAVALRTATARSLGIDEREIGWAALREHADQDGSRATISLFDTAGGGAGYVARVPSQLPTLLREAAAILDCARGCDRACHGCLLSFDTQHFSDQLDRHAARAFLTEKLLLSLALPSELRVFGEGTELEYTDLTMAVVRAMGEAAAAEVRVFLGGDAKEWDRPAWQLSRSLVSFLATSPGRSARIFVPRDVLNAMTWDEANDWADWAHGTGVELRAYERKAPDVGSGWLAVEVRGGTSLHRFAVLDAESLVPGELWGAASPSERCLRAIAALPAKADAVPGTLLDPSKLRRPAPSDRALVLLKNQADGTIAEVGERLLQAIAVEVALVKDRLATKTPAASVVYSDRYLRSPLTARLTYELLRALRDRYGCVGPSTEIRVRTSAPRRNNAHGAAYQLKHDWREAGTQRAVLETLIRGLSSATSIELATYDALPHDRELVITWPAGQTMAIAFDQGMGFLEPASSQAHAFDRSPHEQAARLVQSTFFVRASSRLPTKIYAGGQ